MEAILILALISLHSAHIWTGLAVVRPVARSAHFPARIPVMPPVVAPIEARNVDNVSVLTPNLKNRDGTIMFFHSHPNFAMTSLATRSTIATKWSDVPHVDRNPTTRASLLLEEMFTARRSRPLTEDSVFASALSVDRKASLLPLTRLTSPLQQFLNAYGPPLHGPSATLPLP